MDKIRTIESLPGLPPREFWIASVAEFADIPEVIQPRAKHFVLLLAVDSENTANDTVFDIARKLIRSGLVYLCVWGKDCERIHDLFDEQQVAMELDEEWDGLVMTTSHANELLQDAAWFFKNCAFPGDQYDETCGDWIAVTVKEDKWKETVKSVIVQDGIDWE